MKNQRGFAVGRVVAGGALISISGSGLTRSRPSTRSHEYRVASRNNRGLLCTGSGVRVLEGCAGAKAFVDTPN